MKPWGAAATESADGVTMPSQMSRILSPIVFFNRALDESRTVSAAMPARNQPGFERNASIQRSVNAGNSGFIQARGLDNWQKWSLRHAPSMPVSKSAGKISRNPDDNNVRK